MVPASSAPAAIDDTSILPLVVDTAIVNRNEQISATDDSVPEKEEHEVQSSHIPVGELPHHVSEPGQEKLSDVQLQPSKPSPNVITSQTTLWRDKVKPNGGRLDPQGTPFLLDSGEPCVKIPNSVIEKNKKSWDSFIIGQFYEEAPARGAVHAIANGMWSKHRRDISVSKMEGNAFLFRVPCPNARRRILSQCLWQVDGQTMFVAKWAPGVKPEKPALTTVPVWLDFTGVPLQFFNEDALKENAGLVGHPLCLHPSTLNLTNIEVAKVYTVIDPRKPIPEAVNAQFESGEVVRIGVSSPWLPSLCSHCSKVGHTISKCPSAPPRCSICRSVKHSSDACPRQNPPIPKRYGKDPIRSQLPIVGVPAPGLQHQSTPRAADPKDKRKSKPTTQWVRTEGPRRNENEVFPSRDIPPRAVKQSTAKASDPNHNGKLIVDLCASLFDSPKKLNVSSSKGGDSSSESLSSDEDDPDEENDQYIKVISRREKKKAKSLARARGPLIL